MRIGLADSRNRSGNLPTRRPRRESCRTRWNRGGKPDRQAHAADLARKPSLRLSHGEPAIMTGRVHEAIDAGKRTSGLGLLRRRFVFAPQVRGRSLRRRSRWIAVLFGERGRAGPSPCNARNEACWASCADASEGRRAAQTDETPLQEPTAYPSGSARSSRIDPYRRMSKYSEPEFANGTAPHFAHNGPELALQVVEKQKSALGLLRYRRNRINPCIRAEGST